jgi:hypothetical protein
MKRIILSLAALFIFTGTALFAQDVTGTWQGTLQPPSGSGLRTVLKIAKADSGGLAATFLSNDQSGQGVPVSSITLEGTTFKYAIVGFDLKYEGKLSADGNSITGTSNQATITCR